jgi:hypothetical protein
LSNSFHFLSFFFTLLFCICNTHTLFPIFYQHCLIICFSFFVFTLKRITHIQKKKIHINTRKKTAKIIIQVIFIITQNYPCSFISEKKISFYQHYYRQSHFQFFYFLPKRFIILIKGGRGRERRKEKEGKRKRGNER